MIIMTKTGMRRILIKERTFGRFIADADPPPKA
jgi:hypothetical protein